MSNEETIENADDSQPLTFIAHPPMSTISLQGVAEYFMPDATNEKIMEFIEAIQSRYLNALSDQKKALTEKLNEKIKYWSLDNHHCAGYRGCTPEEEETCKDQWHGYCGYEMDHGIEATDIQNVLNALIKEIE